MLATKYRLKKVRDFNILVKRGLWRRGVLVDLKYLELAKNLDYFPKKADPVVFANQLKWAFAVGLKISKKAITRNRIKRQLSEIVRLFLKENKTRSGFYLLLAPKKDILEAEFEIIKKDVTKLLSWLLL